MDKRVPFLVLVLAGMSLAQKKCCYPNLFEVINGQIIGTLVSNQGVAYTQSIALAYDFTKLRAAELVNSTDTLGQTSRLHLIIEYSKGIQYIINQDTKKCQKAPIPKDVKMMHCVPDNATFLGTSYLGDHQLSIDAFAFPYNHNEAGLVGNMTIALTRGDCLPIDSSFIGNKGAVPILITAGFVDYVAGIKDPSKYFTVPDNCPKAFNAEPLFPESILLKMLFHFQ